jgi:hypothetical protein
MEKTMILSQFAGPVVAEAPPSNIYPGRVGLGGGVVNWLQKGVFAMGWSFATGSNCKYIFFILMTLS